MEASTATTPPQPQHMEALAKANRYRLGYAELKRDIAAGRISAVEALSDPRAVGRCTVGSILSAQRGWGDREAAKFLARIGAPPAVFTKRIGALTDRQYAILAEALAGSTPKQWW